jgi:predicted alpha/beta superfamily hydrolase
MTDWRDYPEAPDVEGHTVVGTVKVLREVESPELGNRRDIFAYLPPSYGEGERRYPVLYMHDGQNLFDVRTAFSEEWHVDGTMEEAARRTGLEAIVVGIPNAGEARLEEYSPFEDVRNGGGRGDAYLDFLLHTLKPLVDAGLRTRPERESTGILGSSMGGLISLYAFFHRPEAFGFAGAMSPSLWFASGAVFDFVRAVGSPSGRLYLDVGSSEGMQAVFDARRMRRLLIRKGYDTGSVFRYLEEAGAEHTEAAWARRLGAALQFLVPR